jgi:hypothetical protein
MEPVIQTKPVERATLDNVDPESIGLLSQTDGGLGATLWKGASRSFVVKLMPTLNLPTASTSLNRLTQRWLLSIATPPEDDAQKLDAKAAKPQSLLALRIDRLIALGDVANAWKLTQMASPDLIDELTLQRVFENALVNANADEACAKLPDIIKSHTAIEWQKVLLICQLRARDVKAAQVTLDLLHAQGVKDEIFMTLIEKNLVAQAKQLPRQLTPLRPLNLALLRLIAMPLPNELYAHPDAALIPALLQARAKEDNSRLALAERAASHGLLTGAALAETYGSVTFPTEQIATALLSIEGGARLRALLYQAIAIEKAPQKHMDLVIKFMQSADPALLKAVAPLLADGLGAIKPAADYYPYAAAIAELDMLAARPEDVQAWLALAKRGAIGMPGVANALLAIWPMRVLGGYESDADYPSDLTAWLDAALRAVDPEANPKNARDPILAVLSLLDAMGFAVPETVWARVVDAPTFDKRPLPSTWLIEQLHAVTTANRRGEIVLLGLLLNNNSAVPDASHLAVTETVHALRNNGLTADAAGLAIETVMDILTPASP